MTPAPSNLRRPTIEARDGRGRSYRFIVEPERPEPVRLDVDYDDALPFSWRELADPLLWVAAVVFLVGLVAALWLIAAFVVTP